MRPPTTSSPIRLSDLFRPGDLNAFFGLMLDNMTQLIILAGILIGVFGMPQDLVLYRMIPGSAVGVLLGDLVYTWMALRLARQTGRRDVTAMPLGIDTPSLFAFTFGIIGPAYQATQDAELTWKIAMAILVLSGVLKITTSLVAVQIRRSIPRAGMLGPIAGIAILLIAFLPSLKIFHHPVVGFLSLGVILVCIVGKLRFPGGIPGAFAGVLVGSGLYYLTAALGWIPEGEEILLPGAGVHLTLPVPTLGFLEGLAYVLPYLPLALPFALAIVVGGIDVTESAAASGDEYSARQILFTDGVATLAAGICGGVVQTTPYIGHPAYKSMGGGAGYTLAVALFIGIGGISGLLSSVVHWIPEAAVAPILIFIGLEIMAQAFQATPAHHHKAVVLSFLPLIAYLVLIQVKNFLGNAGIPLDQLPARLATTYETLLVMANGFIITALLWASTLAHILDHHLKRAALFTTLAAFFSLFGLIHSPLPDGELFLPGTIEATEPWAFAGAYLLLTGFLLGMDWYQRRLK